MKCILTQLTYQFFLHKLGSYRSQWFGGTLHHLGSLCSFDLPPTSKYNTCKKHERLAYTRIDFCFLKNTIFWGVIHDSTRSIHCLSDMEWTGEVFIIKCSGKRIEKFLLQLVTLQGNRKLPHLNTSFLNCRNPCVNIKLCLFKLKIYKKFNIGN